MRMFLLCATALALSLATFGCGGGGGGGSSSSSGGSSSSSGGSSSSSGGTVDTTPPTVASPGISTSTLDFRGGSVTITAQASDPSGILSVVATVQKTNGGSTGETALTATGGGTYSGTYAVPANQHTDGTIDTYTVSVRATDAAGNTSGSYAAGSITVTPPDSTDDPVPPPPTFEDTPMP